MNLLQVITYKMEQVSQNNNGLLPPKEFPYYCERNAKILLVISQYNILWVLHFLMLYSYFLVDALNFLVDLLFLVAGPTSLASVL